jgi:hypothetical protein
MNPEAPVTKQFIFGRFLCYTSVDEVAILGADYDHFQRQTSGFRLPVN